MLSQPNKAICDQLSSGTFLQELEEEVRAQLFTQFTGYTSTAEQQKIVDTLAALDTVLGVIREGNL